MSNTNLPFSNTDILDIARKLDDDVIKSARELLFVPGNIQRLNNYSLVITGTVGSGKSTICESIAYICNTYCPEVNVITYPEFLFVSDSQLSASLLERRLNGSISINTLQSYILDEWRSLLDMNKDKHGFRIYERCVDDTIACFCNMANKDAALSDIQLLSLYERSKEITNEFSVPSYFMAHADRRYSDPGCRFIKIESGALCETIINIIDIIADDLRNDIDQRIIGLSVTPEVSKYRIRLRSRTGESAYTDQAIFNFVNHYEKLYSAIESGKRISRFVDLGTLL